MAEATVPAKFDLTNQRFGRLVAKHVAFVSKGHGRVWHCVCDCGNTTESIRGNLVSGNTKSCGCLDREATGDRFRKHGDTRHRSTYAIWMKMKQRCCNPKCKSYGDYGGRGIRVCEEWAGSEGYPAFIAHIGPRPSLAHTLDRYPDTNGNYEPGNVRWATRTQQNRNTRKTTKVTFNGETKTITEWARDYGMKSGMLYYRLVNKKMSFTEATAKPNEKPRTKVEYQGKTYTINQLAMLVGIDRELLYSRIRNGYAVEKAILPSHPKAPTMMVEYKGQTLSIGEWARRTGLDDLTIKKRIEKMGWSAEQALTTPTKRFPERFRHPDLANNVC
jgi:hypothetical protein